LGGLFWATEAVAAGRVAAGLEIQVIAGRNRGRSMIMCESWQQLRKDSSVRGSERAEIYRGGVDREMPRWRSSRCWTASPGRNKISALIRDRTPRWFDHVDIGVVFG